jgi:hypothetical protein
MTYQHWMRCTGCNEHLYQQVKDDLPVAPEGKYKCPICDSFLTVQVTMFSERVFGRTDIVPKVKPNPQPASDQGT